MTSHQEKEPYIRWFVPRWRGPPKVITITRGNWYLRMAAVLAIWVVAISVQVLRAGTDAAFVVGFISSITILIVFYGWYSGRKGVGKTPAPIFGNIRKKGARASPRKRPRGWIAMMGWESDR